MAASRLLTILTIIILFSILALGLARPINLTAVDIGRHIKNGELILQGQTQVLYKNFYSFTHPDQPFINHHWLFGVLSFGVWKLAGFGGLSLFYIALMLAAMGFFLRAAALRGHFPLAVFFACLALPVVCDRREIRPEAISALFTGLYFYVLTALSLGRIQRRTVFIILGLAQVIWVNSHIFFLMGPFLVAVFLWEGFARGCKVCVRSLWPLLPMLLALNVCNPSGVAGALAPLNVLKQFGYRVAEVQDIFFMMSFFPHETLYAYYLGLIAITAVGIILAVMVRGWKANAAFIFLAVCMAAGGVKFVRMMMPFGFFMVPLAAFFYGQAEGRWLQKNQGMFRKAILVVSLGWTLAYAWSLREGPIGIGLEKGVNFSADFFKKAGLKGPVFNNYDIGSYLIFHLAPNEKVFVDNRPEAFPADFFKNVYIPMQEDDAAWRKIDGQYGFNAIYFYRNDLTPWGQQFLVKRIDDAAWAPVFVDANTIIFLKRNTQNRALIEQFELPRSLFTVVRR